MKEADEDLLRSDYCLYQTEGLRKVAVLGTGPGFLSILDLLRGEEFGEFLPDLRLEALAEPGPDAFKLRQAREAGLPVYSTLEQLLAAHPDIDFLVELTGQRSRVKALRKTLPERISLIDHASAIVFCGLRDMAKVKSHCQVNLDRQRNLLQAIIDEVREDILLLDLQGRVVDMNRNVWQRGGRSKEELLGKACHEVMGLENGAAFCPAPDRSCPFNETLGTREKAETLVSRVDAEGRLLYFRIYSYPILDSLGEMTHIMIMRRDITARTQRERHEQQSDKLALIGEMSTYLAHEIRNPLFAIGGFTNSLLRSSGLSDKDREKLSIIAEETQRLDSMLTSILNFAKPSGTAVQRVDLPAVVAASVELMEIGYGRRGYRFETACGPDLPAVRGEPEMLKQCLVNLYKNAIEAMPDGGTVRTACGLEGGMVLLSVEDQGVGMSEQDLEKACSPFFTTKDKGCGLGLAMIKKIVEEFGGRVEIKSRLREGTTVTLRLPPMLAAPEAPAPA